MKKTLAGILVHLQHAECVSENGVFQKGWESAKKTVFAFLQELFETEENERKAIWLACFYIEGINAALADLAKNASLSILQNGEYVEGYLEFQKLVVGLLKEASHV